MNKTAFPIHLAMLAASSLMLVACGGDPLEGTWESDYKHDGKRDEFTIDSDLAGTGEFQLTANGGGFVKCDGDLTAKLKREGEYNLKIEFKGGSGCSSVPDSDLDCELAKDDTELECGDLIFNLVED